MWEHKHTNIFEERPAVSELVQEIDVPNAYIYGAIIQASETHLWSFVMSKVKIGPLITAERNVKWNEFYFILYYNLVF